MTLIEQLQKGKIAIEAHGKYDDVQRVLNVAFPEDSDRVINHKYTHYYASKYNESLWFFKLREGSLPIGMEAVHIDEFIKELDGDIIISVIPKSEIKTLESKLEAEKELRLKAETQLKKLQPFERGVEGWGYIGHNWSKEKYIYIGRHGYKGHAVDSDRFGLKYVNDFTTENPHKKEIVFHEDSEHKDIKRRLKKAKLVVRRSFNDIYCVIDVYHGIGYVARYLVTQIGDVDQAKFDDKENLKYIDLTK